MFVLEWCFARVSYGFRALFTLSLNCLSDNPALSTPTKSNHSLWRTQPAPCWKNIRSNIRPFTTGTADFGISCKDAGDSDWCRFTPVFRRKGPTFHSSGSCPTLKLRKDSASPLHPCIAVAPLLARFTSLLREICSSSCSVTTWNKEEISSQDFWQVWRRRSTWRSNLLVRGGYRRTVFLPLPSATRNRCIRWKSSSSVSKRNPFYVKNWSKN